ncbi:MAG: hypothetical protein R3F31_20405 [Verrucomicrobiales bacterium]
MNDPLPELTDLDRSIYEWQNVDARRRRGRSATAQRRHCPDLARGGLGSVAMELAAAGVGHLCAAHAGNLKPADLNRQLLQTRDHRQTPH